MNKIDIYLNQIEQLKKVLEFYSDEDNWNKDIVLKDRGFLAKETLKQIKNNNLLMEEYEEIYNKIVDSNKTDENIISILKENNLL